LIASSVMARTSGGRTQSWFGACLHQCRSDLGAPRQRQRGCAVGLLGVDIGALASSACTTSSLPYMEAPISAPLR
jgi:hypothetical protein